MHACPRANSLLTIGTFTLEQQEALECVARTLFSLLIRMCEPETGVTSMQDAVATERARP